MTQPVMASVRWTAESREAAARPGWAPPRGKPHRHRRRGGQIL